MNQQQTVLLFNPKIAKDIGLNESIVLQQLYYWQSKYNNQKWIYNTYEEWQKQFPFWSLRTIRRTFKSLESQNFLQCKRAQSHNLYQLCIDKIKKIFSISDCPKSPPRVAKLADAYKYTKTTTKTNSLSNDSVPEQKNEREKIDIQNLVSIWETHIPSKGQGVELTKTRNDRLKYVFYKYFQSNLKEWEKFILNIKRSKFLMGEVTNFRISLDWSTREENLLKIQEGNYFSKDELEFADCEEMKKEAIRKLDKTQEVDPRWKSMLESALSKFGEATYVSWLSKMELDSAEDGVLKIKTPNNFVKDWIDNNYGRALHTIGKQYFSGMKKICFASM